MKESNDGGPAFPYDSDMAGQPGMSLRDWFAGDALKSGKWDNGERSFKQATEWCGIMADAMIAEREKGNDEGL